MSREDLLGKMGGSGKKVIYDHRKLFSEPLANFDDLTLPKKLFAPAEEELANSDIAIVKRARLFTQSQEVHIRNMGASKLDEKRVFLPFSSFDAFPGILINPLLLPLLYPPPLFAPRVFRF